MSHGLEDVGDEVVLAVLEELLLVEGGVHLHNLRQNLQNNK